MKYLLMIAGLFIGVNSWGQVEKAAEELAKQRILYRGFENKITPTLTNYNDEEFRLVGTNSTIMEVASEDYFIVKLNGREKTETLHLLQFNGSKIDTIESTEYRVANLPVPYVYWGGLKSGGTGNITAKKLSIGYSDEVQLENDFQIVGWELHLKDKTISVKGNDVSSAENYLKDVKSGTTLQFTVKVLGTDGITRLKRAEWEVKSWNEQIEVNPIR